MRKLILLILLLAGLAAAQSLEVPQQARVGEPLQIRVEGVDPGAYPIEIEGPEQIQMVTVLAEEGGGFVEWVPQAEGEYTFKLYLGPGKTLTAQTRVLAPPPPVLLDESGLHVGGKLWPLPKADWLEPVATDETIYLAAAGEPLVLAFPRDSEGEVLAYYPPKGVKELAEGPVLVYDDGSRAELTALSKKEPYADSWNKLGFLRKLADFWRQQGVAGRLPAGPDGYWPYWVYFAADPASLSEGDLRAWGRDLLARGHRPELAWGEGARYWTDAWHAAVAKDPVGSFRLTQALLSYAPLHPGSRAFFTAQAAALEREGNSALAVRLREQLSEIRNFQPLLRAAAAARAFWALLIAYLALMLVIFFRYLPAQRRGLAQRGGLFGSWSRNPLRRLRHLLLAYASWGERLLALLIFASALTALLFWSAGRDFEKAVSAPGLARATLVGASLEDWPQSPGLAALQAYQSLESGDEAKADRLLEKARAPLAFAELLKYRLSGDQGSLMKAYRLEAAYPPVREALELGGDSWTRVYRSAGVNRLGVPRLRDLCRVYLWGVLNSDPLRPLLGLGFKNVAWAYALLALLAVWGLLHVWVLLLPRPRGATRATGPVTRLLELLIPGSNSFGKGWGVVLLLMAAYGALLLYLGDWTWGAALLAAAYLVHVVLWFEEVK